MTKATANEIHIGERTHHHDHVILPVSFNPINKTVSSDTKILLPLFDEDDSSDILFKF